MGEAPSEEIIRSAHEIWTDVRSINQRILDRIYRMNRINKIGRMIQSDPILS